MGKRYWLMKSEPEVYSITDLERDQTTAWEGVRNYQARNFLRDQIKKGDFVFFYHSNAEPSGIAGVAKVIREGYPEAAAWNSKSRYFDPKSSKEKPAWYTVDIQFVKKFKSVLPLENLRKIKPLEKMPLLRRGQRLSVQPVAESEWETILALESGK